MIDRYLWYSCLLDNVGRRPAYFKKILLITAVGLLMLGAIGCRREAPVSASLDSCRLALTAHSGDAAIDREIIGLQERARASQDQSALLEQLGWAYVRKARLSHDMGFYKLAEQCSTCVSSQEPDSAEALLLRGHVLHSLHQFKEAEAIARRLVETRSASHDYALLGDTLMEQGRVSDAVEAYQKMVDLKPGPQAYARIAHIRWLKGDVEGASAMMRKAATTMSTRDADSAAWAYTRLALYQLQTGSYKTAERACEIAFQIQTDYPPALCAQSRVLLAQDRNEGAVALMRKAALINPLSEYQWLLADALRASGQRDEARLVEEDLRRKGVSEDPRTLAIFLSSRGEQLDTALKLVEQEMNRRVDVFTRDALAWALAANGRLGEANEQIRRALAEGTKDARLFYHAGAILAKSGDRQEAREMLKKAFSIKQMLLPSEREDLSSILTGL